ncbi:MAG TPA: hypothetical protein VIJ34_04700 [Acidimicrobiales bacterium]
MAPWRFESGFLWCHFVGRKLTPYIASVHFKDVRWDPTYMLMKFDEV